MILTKERDQLVKERDSSNQEAHLWRSELAKARERVVILEGAVVRAEEKVRVAEADAEARIQEATRKEAAALREKQELLAYVNMLQEQFKRSVLLLHVKQKSRIFHFALKLIYHLMYIFWMPSLLYFFESSTLGMNLLL